MGCPRRSSEHLLSGALARAASVGKGAERGCDMSEEVAASGGVPPREGGEPMALQS